MNMAVDKTRDQRRTGDVHLLIGAEVWAHCDKPTVGNQDEAYRLPQCAQAIGLAVSATRELDERVQQHIRTVFNVSP